MTTTIKVTSHNYPARIEMLDNGKVTASQILRQDDGERTFHCTTIREIRITDLEYEAAHVIDGRGDKPA